MPTYTSCAQCGSQVEGKIELVGSGRTKEAKKSWEVLCDKCEEKAAKRKG